MSCPICGKDSDPKYHPFCSRRCADVDLAHWLRGDYAIPAKGEETDEDAETGEDGSASAPTDGFPDKLH